MSEYYVCSLGDFQQVEEACAESAKSDQSAEAVIEGC